MARPILPTPPITGKAAIRFIEKFERISRGELTEAEMRETERRFERAFGPIKDMADQSG
jgi:hypothetical protein